MATQNTQLSSDRGSEWRKWDLHLHAPGTKRNDQYKSEKGDPIEEYCDKLETSDVHAFGVTDYFSADSYFSVIAKHKDRHPNSKKVFFLNIELRTNETVNKAREEVNLHIIFNPDTYEAKIKEFLQKLKTNKTTTGGRNVSASELTDYDEATVTRIDVRNALKDTFGSEADLSEHVLIFCAANNDGIRTETEEVDGKKRGIKRKAAITDEYDKFCEGFLANSGSTEHFLKRDRLEDKDQIIDAKPCVTGSDAHSFNDIDNWLGKTVTQGGSHVKESTWIKADLTFEGLKQIIYEPAGRVFIGEVPDVEVRVRENQRRYIESIQIDQIAGYDERWGAWFKKEKIELNKELVAIIGN